MTCKRCGTEWDFFMNKKEFCHVCDSVTQEEVQSFMSLGGENHEMD